jgi:hypothetical protein
MLVNFMAIWSILLPFSKVYGHLYVLPSFWSNFPSLVSCTNKNLATLAVSRAEQARQMKVCKEK